MAKESINSIKSNIDYQQLEANAKNNICFMFACRLIDIAEEHNLNQKQLAVIMGVSESNIGSYLKGMQAPKIDVIYPLCKNFNISADYLLGLSSSSFSDVSAKNISYITGLSEKSISFLKDTTQNSTDGIIMKGINAILEYDELKQALYNIFLWCTTETACQKLINDEEANIHAKNVISSPSLSVYNTVGSDDNLLTEFKMKKHWDELCVNIRKRLLELPNTNALINSTYKGYFDKFNSIYAPAKKEGK